MDPRQLIAALALPFLFAALTRIHGRGKLGHTTPLIVGVLLLLLPLTWTLLVPYTGALALAWAFGRKVPFFDGSGAPRTGDERLFSLARQTITPLLACLAAFLIHLDQRLLLLLMIPVIIINTGMRVHYGKLDIDGDTDAAVQPKVRAFAAKVELVEGFTYGAAISAYAILAANGVVIP